jgi:hypothetical protein
MNPIRQSSFERTALGFADDLGGAMRRNPVSTAMIGMGLVWLFAGSGARSSAARLVRKAGVDVDAMADATADVFASGRSALQDGFSRVSDRLSEVADRLPDIEGARNAAGDALRSVRDRGAAAFDRAGEFGRSIPETSADLFGEARERLSTLFEEQPLLLGALGVAIGAGIAASLPSTRLEADLFGEQSDELKAQARSFAHREAAHAEELARAATHAAAEEARRQGLSPEAMSAAANEFGDKAKRVAEAALEQTASGVVDGRQ